ncbi:BspA-like protein [Candidatus Malacoplasma girerdii]|uniref:BspA-like protein n=1 Tax=Candidatus Malacoplasma girerdii TaxID=1318617 RepID=A0A097STA8_9BACT|nr:BspA-like protein [Candidatus Malacoplasma girerdii]
MKLRNFTKFFTWLLAVSAIPVSVVVSNSKYTHSSLIVKNQTNAKIYWNIDEQGNVRPADKSLIKGDVTIPSVWDEKPVTGIAREAFSGCTSLTSIIIPSSITSIGDGAFSICTFLTSVNFAEDSQLNSIGKSAFWNCSSLKTINIPGSVTSIGRAAFYKCSALTSINIPNNVTSIGYKAFSDCSSLTSINFDNDSQLTSIYFGAFTDCSSLTSINIPSSVTEIYAVAFLNTTKLQDITFNWTGKILDDIIQKIKNPVHQRELTTWACIFANYNKKTHSFKDKINVNVHLPKGISNLDVEKYKNNFQGIRNSGSNIPDGIGLDPATTHWIYNSNSNSKLPLILGLTFGFIILIGIGSYLGYRYYKHRKNSK